MYHLDMSYGDGNLIPVDKYDVENAAREMIYEIEKERSEMWERAIDRKMGRKIFPCKTREKAIRSVEKESCKPPFIYPEFYMDEEYDLAKNLLEAVRTCKGDVIYLTIESHSLLSKYM